MYPSKVLDIAAADIGYTENPPGSNKTKYGEWFGMNGQPWCMMAVQYWFDKAGEPLPYKTASCNGLLNWWKRMGYEVAYGDYRPGDIALMDFNGKGITHVGLVESVDPDGDVVTIEGNTSLTNQDNGGAVMRRARSKSVVPCACRPKYEEEEMTQQQFNEMMDNYLKELSQQPPSDWSEEARNWAEGNGIIKGDENGNKQYKKFCTREELTQILYRMK